MFHNHNLLLISILLIPLVGILSIMLTTNNTKTIKLISLITSSVLLVISLLFWILFEKNTANFQFVLQISWIFYLNFSLFFGIDGISLFFIIIITLLFFLCNLISWGNEVNGKQYFIYFLLMEFFLLCAFCSIDLITFYIFFESVLVPMFLLIGMWGSRERKIKAAYYFFFYTLFGSLPMLLAIVYIYSVVGTTNYEVLLTFSFAELEQKFIWFTFFLSFSSKVPTAPLHLWLPEAHVEAPTTGSIILAGVLLKLGAYGFIRFSIPLMPQASLYFSPLVYASSLTSIVYMSFNAIRQTDFKRVIAYVSIAHMNLIVLGIFSFNIIGFEGAILQCLSHGFVASALFLIIGILYERHHTKLIKYYSGLVQLMPINSSIFFFFTLANMSLPGTSNFIGEFLLLSGIFQTNLIAGFFGSTTIILSGCYSLWLFNRVCYGNLKLRYNNNLLEINVRELVALIPLILGTLVIGLMPNILLDCIHITAIKIIELI